MALTEIRVPQLGEGLQEVLIREFLKKPGELVSRDEPIYVMETDKTVINAESPLDGTLQEWLAQVDDVVPIGSPVARILTRNDDAIPLISPAADPLPIRTALPEKPSEEGASSSYVDRTLPPRQRALIFRLNRSSQVVIPGHIGRPIEWQRISGLAKSLNERNSEIRPSEFEIFAYCLTQAVKAHPALRSTILTNSAVREYRRLNLGVAVARPDDELITAVVADADQFELAEFVNGLKRQIRRAWKEGDQAGPATQLILSYMGSYGITDGIPTLVAPASAVVFVGSSYEQQQKLQATVSMTFDHRLINGVGAARFLNQIDREIDILQAQLNSVTNTT